MYPRFSERAASCHGVVADDRSIALASPARAPEGKDEVLLICPLVEMSGQRRRGLLTIDYGCRSRFTVASYSEIGRLE